MISDLDQLIKAFESERKFLEKAIKSSFADNDFLIAHYHFEALSEVNSRLSVLKSFKDPLHNKKQFIIDSEKRLSKTNFSEFPFFKRLDKGAKKRYIDRFSENRRKHFEEQTKKLEASVRNNSPFYDAQEIDKALFNLYNGVYKGFTLSINQQDELVLKFEQVDDQLIISTRQDIQFYEPDFILDSRLPNHLLGLGFKYDIEQQQYSYRCSFLNFRDATPIKILLARIIFDLYKPSDINQNCTLVYYN